MEHKQGLGPLCSQTIVFNSLNCPSFGHVDWLSNVPMMSNWSDPKPTRAVGMPLLCAASKLSQVGTVAHTLFQLACSHALLCLLSISGHGYEAISELVYVQGVGKNERAA